MSNADESGMNRQIPVYGILQEANSHSCENIQPDLASSSENILGYETSDRPFTSMFRFTGSKKVKPLSITENELCTDPQIVDDESMSMHSSFVPAAPHKKFGSFKAIMHLLKANVGTGVLAMPFAIRDAGLLFGTVSILIVSIVVTHSMHLLLESVHYLRNVHIQNTRAAHTIPVASFEEVTSHSEEVIAQSVSVEDVRLDYYETVRMSFLSAPPRIQRWSWLATVLNICLMIGQIGFLAVYQIFVAQNTKGIVDAYDIPNAPDIKTYLLAVFALILPLVFVKSLDKLSFLSTLANFLGIGGLFIVLVYCFQDLGEVVNLPLIRGMDTLPLAFGVIVSAFESISVLLPIENQMKHPEDMRGASGVLAVTMMLVSSLYIAVGFYGYVRFGEDVEGAVIYNLPITPWIYALSKPMYTISIFISYTLQFYVIFSIFWEILSPKLNSRRKFAFADALLRIGIVTFGLLIAMLVPKVELLISFFGALASSAIVLIFPPLIHTINIWQQQGDSTAFRWILVKNSIMIIFGIFGAFLGVAISLKAIIDEFYKS